MKKILCLVICLAMLLSFGGCDMETFTSDSSDGTTVVSTTKEDETTERATTEKQSVATTKTTIQTKETTTKKTTEVTTTKKTTEVTTAKLTEEQKNSITVYVTPSGKRYHLDPDCGGKNSSATDLDRAINMGKTPCKKCA